MQPKDRNFHVASEPVDPPSFLPKQPKTVLGILKTLFVGLRANNIKIDGESVKIWKKIEENMQIF